MGALPQSEPPVQRAKMIGSYRKCVGMRMSPRIEMNWDVKIAAGSLPFIQLAG